MLADCVLRQESKMVEYGILNEQNTIFACEKVDHRGYEVVMTEKTIMPQLISQNYSLLIA